MNELVMIKKRIRRTFAFKANELLPEVIAILITRNAIQIAPTSRMKPIGPKKAPYCQLSTVKEHQGVTGTPP